MQNTRPLKIFQKSRKPTQVMQKKSPNTDAQSVKIEQSSPDHLKIYSKDSIQLPELYSGSEYEEELVNINFQRIGSNEKMIHNKQDPIQIPITSNQTIQSVSEVQKIIQDIETDKNLQGSSKKMPQKHKRVYKRRKILEPVRVGEFFIGRLKKRDRIKPKVTFKDVEEIYRCQCGKDYLSYMGIYNHIKTIHLRKDQYQLFRLHTFKDHQTGKIIKAVIIEQFTSPHPQQNLKNREKPLQNINSNIIIQNASIKQEDGNLNESNLSLSYDEAIRQSRLLRQTPDFSLEPTISLSKYVKLMEDYQKIVNHMSEKEQQNLIRTQRLIQQNSVLYQAKQKYKLKLKLLQAKLQSYMILLQAKDSSRQNISQKDTTPVNDKTVFQISSSQQQSCQLPQFSTVNISNSSVYGSSIEEVFSLGVKNQPKKKRSKGPLPLQAEKGIFFDPQDDENESQIIQKNIERMVKSEEGQLVGKQSFVDSNKTSQQTPCFKGYESDTETQYGEPQNGREIYLKSQDIVSRSFSFRRTNHYCKELEKNKFKNCK